MGRSLLSAFLLVTLSSVAGQPASAPPENRTSSVATQRIVDRHVLTIGDTWCGIANDGSFGSGHDSGLPFSPDTTAVSSASFEFPGGSSREHLFKGGIWVGGLIGTDTLVSAAVWAGSSTRETFSAYDSMIATFDSITGQQITTCTYRDTAFPYIWEPGPRDPGLLGVEVTQTARAFQSPPYDRFVILEYLIRNIRKETIRKLHVGFFADPDVFNRLRSQQPETGAEDDVSGFLPDEAIAYTIDTDGDWRTSRTDDKERNWCPSGFGMAPIYFSRAPKDTSFNWWVTNFGTVEWGPVEQSSPETPSMPLYPADQYQVMANKEIDYDQIYTLANMSSSTWRVPPFTVYHAENIANGFDTRWLMSFGIRDLAPNESLRVVIALVVGDSILQQPWTEQYPLDADSFYAQLSFADLRRNVALARWAWGHPRNLVDAAPVGVRVTPLSSGTVQCSWNPPPTYRVLSGYRIYKQVAGDSTWSQLAEVPASVRSITDDSVSVGKTYQYTVSSISLSGKEGSRSRPVSLKVGRPIAAPVISAKNTPDRVEISWTLPRQDSGFSVNSILNLYRKTENSGDFVLYTRIPVVARALVFSPDPAHTLPRRDPYSMTPFTLIDDSVTPGVMYHYRASLTNDVGIEGPQSPPDSALPMTLDRRGLVAFHTWMYSDMLLDTMREFYGSWALLRAFDTVTPPFRPLSKDPDHPLSISIDLRMETLLRYRVLVLVVEDKGVPLWEWSPLCNTLNRYLRNGGKVVFITRNHGSNVVGEAAMPVRVIRELLGVRRSRLEGNIYHTGEDPHYDWHFSVFFTGAASQSEDYPELEADTILGWHEAGYDQPPDDDSSLTAGRVWNIGCLDSIAEGTEVLYTYTSAYDTSFFHNKPIAVKRITDSTAAILFNFPLSLMKHDQAWRALTQAVADLGIDTTHVAPNQESPARMIIDWLYGRGSGDARPEWDRNHDGGIDIRDVVYLVDQTWREPSH